MPQPQDYSNTVIDGYTFTGPGLKNSNFRSTNAAAAIFRGVLPCDGANLKHTSFVVSKAPGINLAYADLEKANLSYGYFVIGNLRATILEKTTFDRSNLKRADLSSANNNGKGTSFKNTRLFGADLRHVHLPNSDFEGADLRFANMAVGDFTGGNFDNANMTGINTAGSNFTGCSFVGTINPPV